MEKYTDNLRQGEKGLLTSQYNLFQVLLNTLIIKIIKILSFKNATQRNATQLLVQSKPTTIIHALIFPRKNLEVVLNEIKSID